MDALAYARLHPRAYETKFVEKGVRPDMRQLLQFRHVQINTGSVATADASALVRLGDTVRHLVNTVSCDPDAYEL